MEFDWAPLNPAGFKDLGRFTELRAALVNVLRSKLTQSAQFLADAVQQCNVQGCTPRTCLLYRGMVTLRATREMLEGEKGVSTAPAAVRWSTISEMCQTSNHRALQVACTYDRSKEVAVAILIPSEVLVDMLLPEALPQWGIWGTAVIPFQVLLRGCARKAFANSSSVWANDALTRVEYNPETMVHALEDVADKIPGMEQHRTLDMHLKRSADETYAAHAQENRVRLQATINKFWSTVVNGLRQRLGNRAKKIACRESLECDGINCDYCRGAMVFHLASLEQPDKAWCYEYRGEVLDSSTPKQYPRGEWRTALELCSLYGCNDAGLLRTVLTYDRRDGFPVALHVPHVFLEPSMVRVPPQGVLYWKFLPYEGSLEPALPAHDEDGHLEADGASKRASSRGCEGRSPDPAHEEGQPETDDKRASSQGVRQQQRESGDHQDEEQKGEARPRISAVDAADLALLEKVPDTRWGQKPSQTGDKISGKASGAPSEGQPADEGRGQATESAGGDAGPSMEDATGKESGPAVKGAGTTEQEAEPMGEEAGPNGGHECTQPEAGPRGMSVVPAKVEGSLGAEGGPAETSPGGASTQHESAGPSGGGTDSASAQHGPVGPSGTGMEGFPSKGESRQDSEQVGGQGGRGLGAEPGGHGVSSSSEERQGVGEDSGAKGSGEQGQQQLQSQQQQSQQGQRRQPYRCALQGCCVWEEESTGVQLLVCSCKRAAYCTRDHQRLDWRKAHAAVHKAQQQQQ